MSPDSSIISERRLSADRRASDKPNRADHAVTREGLVATLKPKNLEIVGKAADDEEAWQLYDQLSPDVLVLDLRMPRKDALQIVIELIWSCRPSSCNNS